MIYTSPNGDSHSKSRNDDDNATDDDNGADRKITEMMATMAITAMP